MYRFLDIKINDVSALEFEDVNDDKNVYGYKAAVYYLNEITKEMPDNDLKKWLKEREQTGFNPDDIRQLQNIHNNPSLKYCLNIINFPQYCNLVIFDCISLNKNKGGYKKWL